MKTWFPIILVLFATFFWGTTFILVKATISLLPVNYFLFLRFALATLLTAPVFFIRKKYRDKNLWRQGMILGLLLFASYYFQTIGLLYTTPANAAFITGLNIIFIPILGALIFKAKISGREQIAVILSFIGTILLTVNFSNLTVNVGDIIILGTAVSIALHILLTERYVENTLVELLWIQFFTMSVCAAILAIFSKSPEIIWYTSSLVLFTLFVTVILGTIYAFAAQLYAQQAAISSSIIGVLFSIEPVFALIIDIIVGYIPTYLSLIGMILIFISIMIATLSTSKKPPQVAEI